MVTGLIVLAVLMFMLVSGGLNPRAQKGFNIFCTVGVFFVASKAMLRYNAVMISGTELAIILLMTLLVPVGYWLGRRAEPYVRDQNFTS